MTASPDAARRLDELLKQRRWDSTKESAIIIASNVMVAVVMLAILFYGPWWAKAIVLTASTLAFIYLKTLSKKR